MLRTGARDISYIYCNGCPPPSAPMSNLAYNLDTAEKTNSCNNYNKQASEQNWTNFSTEQNQLGQRGNSKNNSSESNCHSQGFQAPECLSPKGCCELPGKIGTVGKELHLLKQLERPSSRASSRARPDDLDIWFRPGMPHSTHSNPGDAVRTNSPEKRHCLLLWDSWNYIIYQRHQIWHSSMLLLVTPLHATPCFTKCLSSIVLESASLHVPTDNILKTVCSVMYWEYLFDAAWCSIKPWADIPKQINLDIWLEAQPA